MFTKSLAKQAPDQAVKILVGMLEQGLAYDFMEILKELHKADKVVARRQTTRIIDKLLRHKFVKTEKVKNNIALFLMGQIAFNYIEKESPQKISFGLSAVTAKKID